MPAREAFGFVNSCQNITQLTRLVSVFLILQRKLFRKRHKWFLFYWKKLFFNNLQRQKCEIASEGEHFTTPLLSQHGLANLLILILPKVGGANGAVDQVMPAAAAAKSGAASNSTRPASITGMLHTHWLEKRENSRCNKKGWGRLDFSFKLTCLCYCPTAHLNTCSVPAILGLHCTASSHLLHVKKRLKNLFALDWHWPLNKPIKSWCND